MESTKKRHLKTSIWAIWPILGPPGKKTKRQKDEKTTSQDPQMSHLTKIISPWKKEKETKRRKNDISRPPNEASDQIYTPLKKRQKDKTNGCPKGPPPRKRDYNTKIGVLHPKIRFFVQFSFLIGFTAKMKFLGGGAGLGVREITVRTYKSSLWGPTATRNLYISHLRGLGVCPKFLHFC